MNTTTDYVRDHLIHIDTTEIATSLVPQDFRDVDYPVLNGIDSSSYIDDPTAWDNATHTDEN